MKNRSHIAISTAGVDAGAVAGVAYEAPKPSSIVRVGYDPPFKSPSHTVAIMMTADGKAIVDDASKAGDERHMLMVRDDRAELLELVTREPERVHEESRRLRMMPKDGLRGLAMNTTAPGWKRDLARQELIERATLDAADRAAHAAWRAAR